MEELIAKRHVKALQEVLNIEELESALEYFKAVATLFRDWKVREFFASPEVDKDAKVALLLAPIKENAKLVNFIKVLAQKNRLNIIPAVASELATNIALAKKEFTGRVYSEYELSSEELARIADALQKRVGGTIQLVQASQKYDGIKVEVDTVGLEVDFSKSKIKKQLIENILKAI